MAHRWSGWPGAWCLDFGIEDPNEVCLADHDHVNSPQACPVDWKSWPRDCPEPGSMRHDPYARRTATDEKL